MQTFAIEGPPFNLKLSPWDRRTKVLYSKRILAFRLSVSNQEHTDRIVRQLYRALKSTVEDIPFLAGAIVPWSEAQPWLHNISPQGAAYLEVQDLSQELSFSDLYSKHFPPSLLDATALCPSGKADICRFRATFIDGGLLLAVSISHTVFDGRGITEVMKTLAGNLRNAPTESLSQPAAHAHPGGFANQDQTKYRDCYSCDRTMLVSGQGRIGAIESHPGLTTSNLDLPSSSGISTRCHVFCISSESLLELKKAASPYSSSTNTAAGSSQQEHGQSQVSDHPPWISTHDAIAALMWRSIILARHRAGIIDQQETFFSQAVDCRAHLGLPKPYFGNVAYITRCSSTVSNLKGATGDTDDHSPSGLRAAAQAIRKEVNNVTEEKFRDLMGFLERTEMETSTITSTADTWSTRSVFLLSYYGFEMYDIDFGEALGRRIEAFRLPSQGVLLHVPVILPRLPDGSCEFIINEQREVMDLLVEDQTFRSFAYIR
ncbi:hypothetical protein Q9189_007386, partial [Teloschistes chrysophthalmus]